MDLQKILKDNNIQIITLANNGYLKFTYNCIKSLEKLGLTNLIKVYCADKKCYADLKNEYSNIKYIDSEYNKNISRLRRYPSQKHYTETEFKDVVFLKFVAISDALEKSNVIFVDSDVVFLNEKFLEYLLNNIKNNEILFQNEGLIDNTESGACSGLMYMKSTSSVKNFFDPTTVIHNEHWISNVGDQDYVNKNKEKLKYDYMDCSLFTNGRIWRKHHKKLNPYMVHFNWMKVRMKVKMMKRTGGWFL